MMMAMAFRTMTIMMMTMMASRMERKMTTEMASRMKMMKMMMETVLMTTWISRMNCNMDRIVDYYVNGCFLEYIHNCYEKYLIQMLLYLFEPVCVEWPPSYRLVIHL